MLISKENHEVSLEDLHFFQKKRAKKGNFDCTELEICSIEEINFSKELKILFSSSRYTLIASKRKTGLGQYNNNIYEQYHILSTEHHENLRLNQKIKETVLISLLFYNPEQDEIILNISQRTLGLSQCLKERKVPYWQKVLKEKIWEITL